MRHVLPAGVERAERVLHLAVRLGGATVLPQMLRPRFDQITFDTAVRVRRVHKQLPEHGSVPPANGSHQTTQRRGKRGALRRLELEGFAERPLGSLSGGELQRAVLARALAQEAPVLLLDEPTTALDLGRQQLVLELVDALRADGLTVVTTMHDLTLAGQYAERLVLLDGGSVVAEGTAAEVLSAPNVASHYGANVRIVEDEGGVFVLPVRSR